jgi:hypothetical protein
MPRREFPIPRFWIAVGVAVWASILLFNLIPNRSHLEQPSPAEEVIYGLVLITLVLVVWAICFRAQLEARRVSLVAIFALVTMLAALFSAFRYFDPLGIYPG